MAVRRTRVTCPDPFCDFGALADGDGLPVVVVDEEIYRLLPSLIIGTVDKFAQLTWRGETQGLFGRVQPPVHPARVRHRGHHGQRMGTGSDTSVHPARAGEPPARIEKAAPLRPPDLIIQDELHLISGPLGSMVGLYEAAVDRLATWDPGAGQAVASEGHRIDGDGAPRAAADRGAVRPPDRGVPAAGTGYRRQLLRPPAPDRP